MSVLQPMKHTEGGTQIATESVGLVRAPGHQVGNRYSLGAASRGLTSAVDRTRKTSLVKYTFVGFEDPTAASRCKAPVLYRWSLAAGRLWAGVAAW